MTTELTMLAWTLVLALVQVFLPIMGRTRQLGSKWNAGPRDEPLPPPDPVTGRLERAQRNLYETLPLFIAAVTGRLSSSAFTATDIRRTISYPAGVPCIGSSLNTDHMNTLGRLRSRRTSHSSWSM